MTLRRISVLSGIGYSAISTYSSGAANPSPPRLVRLAEVLGLPTTDLAPLREKPTLHELRWHAGLTAAELAEKAGYSLAHTSAVLAGVSPITSPARWSKALGVDEARIQQAWEASRAEQNPEE